MSEVVIEGCQDPSTLGSGHPWVSGVASSIAIAIDQELISEVGNYFSKLENIFPS